MSCLKTRLQEVLQLLYRLDELEPVSAYTIGSDELHAVLGSASAEGRREALVVHQDGEWANIGLYISDEVMARAEAFAGSDAPEEASGPLDAFCVALEGVSHFVYLSFCAAAQDRPVSRIELELQAEVDKYLVLRLLFPMPGLIGRLYEAIRLDERLPREEQERYRVANDRARRYARWFERRLGDGRGNAAVDDARRLYRKPLAFKLDHIERAAA